MPKSMEHVCLIFATITLLLSRCNGSNSADIRVVIRSTLFGQTIEPTANLKTCYREALFCIQKPTDQVESPFLVRLYEQICSKYDNDAKLNLKLAADCIGNMMTKQVPSLVDSEQKKDESRLFSFDMLFQFDRDVRLMCQKPEKFAQTVIREGCDGVSRDNDDLKDWCEKGGEVLVKHLKDVSKLLNQASMLPNHLKKLFQLGHLTPIISVGETIDPKSDTHPLQEEVNLFTKELNNLKLNDPSFKTYLDDIERHTVKQLEGLQWKGDVGGDYCSTMDIIDASEYKVMNALSLHAGPNQKSLSDHMKKVTLWTDKTSMVRELLLPEGNINASVHSNQTPTNALKANLPSQSDKQETTHIKMNPKIHQPRQNDKNQKTSTRQPPKTNATSQPKDNTPFQQKLIDMSGSDRGGQTLLFDVPRRATINTKSLKGRLVQLAILCLLALAIYTVILVLNTKSPL